jgi:hypothetical protein
MAYDSTKLVTITSGYAEYTANQAETLAVLLGAAYFSGVTAGTVIKVTDGTIDAVPGKQSGFTLVVDAAGTARVAGAGVNVTVSATATSDGLTTGILTDPGCDFTVLVTSANANNIIVLPAPVVGRKITLLNQSATAYELRSSAPATVAIGGGTGANAESAIPASSIAEVVCRTATAWHGYSITAATLAAIEAAA